MKLYQRGTWQATERLERLRAQDEALTLEDVTELFEVFKQGCDEYGNMPTLYHFGEWLSGLEPGHEHDLQAEVGW